MSSRGIIAEGARGHRRGVVMGFTMAELMLLLLFCLLLATAGVLAERDQRIAELEALPRGEITTSQLAALAASDARLNALLAMLGTPKLTAPQIDELWQELTLAKSRNDTFTDLVEARKPLTEAEREQLIAALAAMVENGLTPADMARLAELTPAQRAALRQSGEVPGAGHQWPPIISLSDNGNRFATGSAGITSDFRRDLEERVAPEVAERLAAYDADVIEIIGHTDEQVITPTRPSNLDTTALEVMQGRRGAETMVADDNAGLGLARAIAVASVLKGTGRFEAVKLVPLSAAQLLLPGDTLSPGGELAQGDQRRRRIEIRVRRSTEVTN